VNTLDEAEQVVQNNPIEVEFQTRRNEERIQLIGVTDAQRILIVVATWRGDNIRVVTAFLAPRDLRRFYATKIGVSNESQSD
jgi:uncharacterized DUF497 family protein